HPGDDRRAGRGRGGGGDRHADAVEARGVRIAAGGDAEGPGGGPRRGGARGRGGAHARALAGALAARGEGGEAGGGAVPDRGARHGGAVGAAAQGDQEEGVYRASRGEEPAGRLVPARAVAA